MKVVNTCLQPNKDWNREQSEQRETRPFLPCAVVPGCFSLYMYFLHLFCAYAQK